jgi:thioesterase domain-containing protein
MVQIMREVQPVGPYRLAGYSFGGTLAYEIATQLRGEDDSVEFLGMFDTHCDNGAATPEERSEEDFLLRVLYQSVKGDPRSEELIEELRSSSEVQDFETLAGFGQELSLLPPELTVTDIRAVTKVAQAVVLANAQYFTQPIHIPVHLFLAQGSKDPDLRGCDGWTDVLTHEYLRVIPVPGTHSSMFQIPNIDSLGGAFSAALQATARDGGVRAKRAYAPLVPLQRGRAGVVTPLVCVPGAGASVVSFNDLSESLGKGRPVYGLQPRGLDSLQVPHTSLSATVECYLQALQETHPLGPVHLLGHSFGGWIVFEMACRLEAVGRETASITMVDSEVPDVGGSPLRQYSHVDVLLRWIETLEMNLETPLGIGMEELAVQSSKVGQLALIHERLVQYGVLSKTFTPDHLRGPLNVFAAALRTRYTPRSIYRGKVHLTLINDAKLDEVSNQRNKEELVEGWHHWAPDLEVFDAPGTHMTTLKTPHVDALATRLLAIFGDGDRTQTWR